MVKMVMEIIKLVFGDEKYDNFVANNCPNLENFW